MIHVSVPAKKTANPSDLIGSAEIEAEFGIQPATIRARQRQGIFPAPVAKVARGTANGGAARNLWCHRDVEEALSRRPLQLSSARSLKRSRGLAGSVAAS